MFPLFPGYFHFSLGYFHYSTWIFPLFPGYFHFSLDISTFPWKFPFHFSPEISTFPWKFPLFHGLHNNCPIKIIGGIKWKNIVNFNIQFSEDNMKGTCSQCENKYFSRLDRHIRRIHKNHSCKKATRPTACEIAFISHLKTFVSYLEKQQKS